MLEQSPNCLDEISRARDVIERIKSKPFLKMFYEEIYKNFVQCKLNSPKEGMALELGSGGGFLKEYCPDFVTSDIIEYPNVDQVVDGTKMPFEDESLTTVCLLNVLHHIPDAESFFSELNRCLLPGGRVFIVDQHKGWINTPILKYVHHEPFLPTVKNWKFESSGPLSDANAALAWIIFSRDIKTFEEKFPKLKVEFYRPHSPLRYWLTGGLKSWSLLPRWAFYFATLLDRILVGISSNLGSFVNIEIVKRA